MTHKIPAVFFDRDGVINKLIYHKDHGKIDSPITPRQFQLLPGVAYSIKSLKELGYLVIIVSNQPNIGKGHVSLRNFELTRAKMHRELEKLRVSVDDEAYCFHHPNARLKKYRKNCSCRKPKPGLILRAARDHGIDLPQSYVIGDGLTDIQAGKAAHCKTVLIGHWSSLLSKLMCSQNAYPDFVAPNLVEAVHFIRG